MAYGKSLRGGLLLWGPPGCGKTHIARAIAGELDATFISVGIHEVLDMWVGSSERNLHGWFELARRERPSVLFFDELDALGHSRTREVTGAVRNVVATLLTELDGLGADNESVFTLAATNQPWDVDPALRRPGRFDRTVAVMPPDESARAAILAVHLRNRPVGEVDLARLAKATHGFSGADLRLVCEAAVELAFAEASASGRLVPVSQSHLLRAVAETKPSVGSWLDHARNYVNYANDDGTYDELADYLKTRQIPTLSTADAHARSAVLRSRAQALRSTGRIKDALDVLRDAVAAAPEDPANFCEIGLCQLDAENWSEARRAASSALRLQPHSQLALRIVALSGCHIPGGSREALDAAKLAVELGPSAPANVNALACVYLEMRTLNAARAQAERALQLAPSLSYVHATVGSIALAQGRLTTAEHHFRVLLHDDPNSWTAENNLGVVALRRGRSVHASRATSSLPFALARSSCPSRTCS